MESRKSPEDYDKDWRKAAQQDDEIEDDSIFEPIQDDNFEEDEYIKAPKLDLSELSTEKGSDSDRFKT